MHCLVRAPSPSLPTRTRCLTVLSADFILQQVECTDNDSKHKEWWDVIIDGGGDVVVNIICKKQSLVVRLNYKMATCDGIPLLEVVGDIRKHPEVKTLEQILGQVKCRSVERLYFYSWLEAEDPSGLVAVKPSCCDRADGRDTKYDIDALVSIPSNAHIVKDHIEPINFYDHCVTALAWPALSSFFVRELFLVILRYLS